MKYLKKLVLFMAFVAIFCCLSLPVHAASLAAPKASVKTIASSGKVQISWGKVKQAKNYKVYYSTQKTGEYTLLGTTTGTKLTHSAAEAETTYYYYVRAAKGKTLSAKSKVVSATCDLPQPKIKLSTDAQTGKIKISWNAVEGAVKYQVYRATSKTGKYSLMKTTTATSWINTSASAGKTYYYKVRAVAAKTAANSAYSAISSCVCDLAQPSVTISKDGAGKPRVSWKSVSGAVKYQVYRATGTSKDFSLIKTTTSTSTTDTSAKNGKTYTYKVRAIASKSAANSAYSAVKSVTAGEEYTTAYVLQPSIALYAKTTDKKSAVTLKYMEEVQIGGNVSESKSGTWTKIKYNKKIYYTWIAKGVIKFTTEKSTFQYETTTDLQKEVIQAVLKYKDLPTYYAHNASNGEIDPENGKYGFDCSGLAAYALNTAMRKYNPLYRLDKNILTLYHSGASGNSDAILYNNGFANSFAVQSVCKEDLQPGDVIFFKQSDDSRVVDHCGIYLGNNEFIHATSFFDTVCVMPLTGSYEEDYVAARRYIPTEVIPANQTVVANRRARLYTARSDQSDWSYIFQAGEEGTILFVEANGIWGYMRNNDGVEGYVLMKCFDLVTE